MKMNIRLGNREIACYTIQLCSYGESADYEFLPSESLHIELSVAAQSIRTQVDYLKSAANRFLMFSLQETEVTFYRSGRMILENVQPAQDRVAMDIGRRILEMTGTGPIKIP